MADLTEEEILQQAIALSLQSHVCLQSHPYNWVPMVYIHIYCKIHGIYAVHFFLPIWCLRLNYICYPPRFQSDDHAVDAAISALKNVENIEVRDKTASILRIYMENLVKDETNPKYRRIRYYFMDHLNDHILPKTHMYCFWYKCFSYIYLNVFR